MANFATNRLSVKFRRWDWGVIWDAIEACGGEYGGRNVPQLRLVTVLPREGDDIEALRVRLEAHPEVERAGYPIIPERRAYHAATNDTYINWCWHLARVNVFHAWKGLAAEGVGRGSPSIRIAVHDSGLVMNHPDLVYPDASYHAFTGEVGYYQDLGVAFAGFPFYYSHGTNCWSTVKAGSGNGIGVAGICPDAYGVFVADDGDSGDQGDVVAGIMYQATAGAKLASWSWGYNLYPTVLDTPGTWAGHQDLIEATLYLMSTGCLVFSAAGNSNEQYDATNHTADPSVEYFPNDIDGVINVAGCGGGTVFPYDDPWTNSAWGAGIDFVAPAMDIFMVNHGTQINAGPFYGPHGFNWMLGENGPGTVPSPGDSRSGYGEPGDWPYVSTSFAGPIAMGVAALVWSANPSLTGPQVVQIMRDTASPGHHANWTTRYPTAGLVNAGKGVAKARSTRASNAGVPIPYVGFSGPNAVTTVTGGVASTTLNGEVWVDVSGFCDGDEVGEAELWIGSDLVYRGPPAMLRCVASSSGTARALTVKARSGSTTSEESFSDVVADSLSVDGEFHIIRASVGSAQDDAFVELVLSEQGAVQVEDAPASDGYEVGLTLGMRQGESVRAFEGETLGLRYGVQQGESVRATDAASGPLLDAVHVIRASCGASYDDATVSLVLAAQVGQALEAAIASDACAASIRAAAGQAESAIALDRLLGHRVKIKGPTGPRVPPWWKRHSRGGRLWSK